MTQSNRLVRAIFDAALLLPPERRAAHVQEASAGDARLHQRVEALLRAYEEAGTFMENPAAPPTPGASLSSEAPAGEALPDPAVPVPPAGPNLKMASPGGSSYDLVGQTIGRYKLLEKVGEGGCGVVYGAEQAEPVRRRVALKVIKLGMDTKAVVARFEAERQALAMMDHPNIAKVFDAGTTEKGGPYFVMELVRGIPITHYCDQAQLTTQERLELFIKVCQAVQHAHQKGIIHRDIKPSNILVTLHDGVPVPKVIDFGIAKAIEGRLTEHTVYTQMHQLIGTPAYMSPEQAEMTGLDIDTRSDIYSLGVLLYELLAGSTPFDTKELMAAGLDAMRKIIREQEPTRPSTKLSQTLVAADMRRRKSGGTDESASSRRRLHEKIHQLRGDLDWIVMKCLEKDRTRRYETANGLAFDLKRHLDDEPVLARAPSTAYRFQKAFRRHKLSFTATAVVAAALVAGTVVSTWEAMEAGQARNAEKGQRIVAQTERDKAQAAQQRTVEALISLEVQKSETLFAAEDSSAALAYLARASRRDRSSPVAAGSLFYALTQRSLNLRLVEPLAADRSAQFSPDGRRVVTASSDGTARVWDAQTGQPLTHPLKHAAGANSAQFSPNGLRVVTASADHTARVWDAQTGQPVTDPLKHANEVKFAQFSPDGRRVVTASADATARVWDAQTGQPVTEPLKHEGPVGCAQFSPDGQRVVTASYDNTARVWDAKTGQPVAEPLKHANEVRSARFSPDGQRVVTGSLDGTARVWDARTGLPLTEALKHAAGVSAAQFSPDGQRVVTASDDKTARVWDAGTGQPLTDPLKHKGYVASAQFSPDGQRVVTASWDNTARVWDAQTGQPLTEPLRHSLYVHSAEFSPDGRSVLTASEDGTARVWEAPPGPFLTRPLRHAAQVRSAQFSPNGQRIVTASHDFTARVWDAQTGQALTPPLTHKDNVTSAQFSPDGQRVVTISCDSTARVWDAQTGQPVTPPLQHKGEVRSAAFSPDGQRVVTGSLDGTARVWDARTGQPLGQPFEHAHGVNSVQFSPDGQRVVTASDDQTARVWDARTGQPLTEPLQHKGYVRSARFSPDGQRVVTASWDRTARVWDAQTGQPLAELRGHSERVDFAEFSPDGRKVVTASWDRTARVWDAQTGRPLTPPLKHESVVWSARFSPDGQRVATASVDATAQVWDARTGRPVTEPLKHGHTVVSAQFSPDGQRLATASDDQTARIWEVPPLPLPVPEWVLNLTEAAADRRLDEQGFFHRVDIAELHALKQQVSESAAVDVWTRWAKWIFADPASRTISPFSPLTVPEYARRRIQENTLESLREAVRLSPDDGLALARLGWAILAQPAADNPRQAGEAAWHSLRAVQCAPLEAEVWELRGDILEHEGRRVEALEAYDRCLALFPGSDPAPGSAQARASAKRAALRLKAGP